jgi:hypothetical protein
MLHPPLVIFATIVLGVTSAVSAPIVRVGSNRLGAREISELFIRGGNPGSSGSRKRHGATLAEERPKRQLSLLVDRFHQLTPPSDHPSASGPGGRDGQSAPGDSPHAVQEGGRWSESSPSPERLLPPERSPPPERSLPSRPSQEPSSSDADSSSSSDSDSSDSDSSSSSFTSPLSRTIRLTRTGQGRH